MLFQKHKALSNRLFNIFSWFGLTIRHTVEEMSLLAHTVAVRTEALA